MSPETVEINLSPLSPFIEEWPWARTPETIVKKSVCLVDVVRGDVNMLCAQAQGLVVRQLSFVVADFCYRGRRCNVIRKFYTFAHGPRRRHLLSS